MWRIDKERKAEHDKSCAGDMVALKKVIFVTANTYLQIATAYLILYL